MFRGPFHTWPSVHRSKPVAEFLHHHVEWGGVSRGFDDGHKRLDAEFCAEVFRVYFPHERLVGLADGDRDGSCGHIPIEHQLVYCIEDFAHFIPLKDFCYPLWLLDGIAQGHRGYLCFPNPRHRRARRCRWFPPTLRGLCHRSGDLRGRRKWFRRR